MAFLLLAGGFLLSQRLEAHGDGYRHDCTTNCIRHGHIRTCNDSIDYDHDVTTSTNLVNSTINE